MKKYANVLWQMFVIDKLKGSDWKSLEYWDVCLVWYSKLKQLVIYISFLGYSQLTKYVVNIF